MKKKFILVAIAFVMLSRLVHAQTINGITVVLDYPDLAFRNSIDSVSLMMNQTGFSGWGSQGSVKDFFFTQSNGNVVLTSKVIKVLMPHPSDFYHAPGATGDMVGDIVNNINQQFPNGVPNLTAHPTQGGLWHFNILTRYPGGGYSFGYGNKFIISNGMSLEIKRGNISFLGTVDPPSINTMCHEMGHSVMEWTDYYRTAFCNLGDYDVMASAGTRRAPQPINPALRLQKNWISNVVNVSGTVTATYTLTANSYSQIHKYTNPNNPKEYLLFHVLKHGGYYQSPLDNGKTPDEGLAIWYVDEDSKFDLSGVDKQYFIRLVQADNLDEMHDEFTSNFEDVRGDMNDMYDNISNSFPNGHPFRWKDGGEFGISITNISAPGATMSFTVNARPNTVIASSDFNGNISPKGTLSVANGQSKTFTFTPNLGYELDVVTVNGATVAATNPYTLTGISGTTTIQASFRKKTTIDPLPSPWVQLDLGTSAAPGLAAQSNGTFNIESSGSDLGGNSDNFRFVFQTLNGNGSIVARVAATNMSSWSSKVGLMIRESLQTNAVYSMIAHIPHSGVAVEQRDAVGAGPVFNPNGTANLHIYSLHNWFKISRAGNQVTNSCSRDGINWVVISQQNFPAGASVYVGMFTTGAFGSYPSKGVFDNITVTTANPSPAVSITSPVDNTVFTNSASITIAASAADANGSVAKVEFYNGTQLLGTDNSAPYSFTWTNVSGGKYTLTAKATDNQGAITTSIPVRVSVPCTFSGSKLTGTVIGTLGSWGNLGNTREKAFDGDVTTFFDGTEDLAWTGLSLSKGFKVTGINFYPRQEFAARMLNGRFQGSNTADFSSGVVDLGTIVDVPSYAWNCMTVFNAGSFKYLRYIGAAGGVGNVAEIEFYGTEASGNIPPTAIIMAPSTGNSFTSPANITINVTASDADGTISKVEFYNGTSKLGEDASSPYSYTWTGVTAGTYVITANAIDNLNATTTSSPATITVSPATTNLALNKPTYASSVENSGTPAKNATDGSGSSRWSSAFSDPQWVTVNLGGQYAINRVKIAWEAAAAKDYSVQVSSDSVNWTTIKTVSGNSTLTNDLTGISGTGKFVKIYGTARVTAYGYSIFELEVYGTTITINEPPIVSITSPGNNALFTQGTSIVINATATDPDSPISKVEFYNGASKLGEDVSSPYSYSWNGAAAGAYSITAKAIDNLNASTTSSPVNLTVNPASTNLALNKPTYASSVENSGTLAKGATDGSSSSRWSSAFSDPQWIVVNLGSQYAINRVKIAWEAAAAKDYSIQVSADSVHWTTIKTVTGNTALTNDLTSLSGTGKFVKIYGTARVTPYGYSIFELEVYGSLSASQALQRISSNEEESTNGTAMSTTEVLVYPNPINQAELTVTGIFPENSLVNLQINDVMGSVLVNQDFTTSSGRFENKINVESLPVGAYVLKLSYGGHLFTRKLLKN